MKSEETPPLSGENKKANSLTFPGDSDEMRAEALDESSRGYESIMHQRR